MRHVDSRRAEADPLALLARPGLADAAQARFSRDEAAFSASVEAWAERWAETADGREAALAAAYDQAYRAVLASGGEPELAPRVADFEAAEGAALARVCVGGRIGDLRKAGAAGFVEAGDLAYVIGSAAEGEPTAGLYKTLRSGVSGRMVRSCRAIGAPGGLALALAAACLQAGRGLRVLLDDLPGAPDEPESLLFGTEGSRFIAGVRREDRERFERSFAGLPHRLLGLVTETPDIFFTRRARLLVCLRPDASGYDATAYW